MNFTTIECEFIDLLIRHNAIITNDANNIYYTYTKSSTTGYRQNIKYETIKSNIELPLFIKFLIFNVIDIKSRYNDKTEFYMKKNSVDSNSVVSIIDLFGNNIIVNDIKKSIEECEFLMNSPYDIQEFKNEYNTETRSIVENKFHSFITMTEYYTDLLKKLRSL